MTGIARILVSFFLVLALASTAALGAGPFPYRLPQGSADPSAVGVVGQPQTHHILRYENCYPMAPPFSDPLRVGRDSFITCACRDWKACAAI